jgi:hypothetical protein
MSASDDKPWSWPRPLGAYNCYRNILDINNAKVASNHPGSASNLDGTSKISSTHKQLT